MTKKKKEKDAKRQKIINAAGLAERDVDPPGFIDWRMHLNNQAGSRDPKVKY